MKRFFRKMQKISESYFVSLPKSWISQFALDKNSTVAIDIRSDGCLIINPKIKEEGKPEEEIVLTMIKTTPKDIVKNSLLGIEKIVVISDKKIEPNILQQIKFVIDRLPNTEIIEQSDQRIEIHNFDIGNVPTRKLIRRLFNLAEDMFENIRNDKKNELKSNYNNLRKFYYILVTHTRMYFRTGIYVS
ncbi:MAG: AbrB/MazE/SpoVT family DNA-binding domain-containing protein, partial [Promethearchaeota archaeon]